MAVDVCAAGVGMGGVRRAPSTSGVSCGMAANLRSGSGTWYSNIGGVFSGCFSTTGPSQRVLCGRGRMRPTVLQRNIDTVAARVSAKVVRRHVRDHAARHVAQKGRRRYGFPATQRQAAQTRRKRACCFQNPKVEHLPWALRSACFWRVVGRHVHCPGDNWAEARGTRRCFSRSRNRFSKDEAFAKPAQHQWGLKCHVIGVVPKDLPPKAQTQDPTAPCF